MLCREESEKNHPKSQSRKPRKTKLQDWMFEIVTQNPEKAQNFQLGNVFMGSESKSERWRSRRRKGRENLGDFVYIFMEIICLCVRVGVTSSSNRRDKDTAPSLLSHTVGIYWIGFS